MKTISKEVFENAMTYNEYFNLVNSQAEEGKTSGEQDAAHIDATKVNAHRMKRVAKTTTIDSELSGELKNYGPGIRFLVIAESWCGDASQNIPSMAKMAEACNCVDIRVIMRDENLEIMDQFLTNGGRAIPIMLLLDKDYQVLGKWGPRPKVIQDQVMANKVSGEYSKEEMNTVVQRWYVKDKGLSLQQEIIDMLEAATVLQ